MKQFARWISIVAHPFTMITLLAAVPAIRHASRHTFQSVLLVMFAVIVPIGLLMILQVRRGQWSNVDASNASERPALFLIALVALVATRAWLRLKDPQSFLVQGILVTAGFVLVAAFLNRWIKLSLHIAFSALTATTLSLMGSWVGYVLIAVIPLVFWSRLALARHRVHELAVGLVLGALTGLCLFRL